VDQFPVAGVQDDFRSDVAGKRGELLIGEWRILALRKDEKREIKGGKWMCMTKSTMTM